MQKDNTSRLLPWFQGALLLGAVFFLAVAFVKPIGVSTQFVIFDAMIWDVVDPTVITEEPTAKSGYASTNAYLDKSGGKYAKNAAHPVNYSFIFVLAMAAGAFVSSRLGGDRPNAETRYMPDVWRSTMGPSSTRRLWAAFMGGFIVLFGARLAGGCTSGHMMSGMMQTAVSGYLFTAALFATAVLTAWVLYRKTEV
ncbi:MAG: hypothetical protein CMF31_07925 [Kordiimonas sp.]|nr:hypothetical protein [Kordiimonas sp.]